MLDHVTRAASDVETSHRFDDAVLASIGITRLSAEGADFAGYGVGRKAFFWIRMGIISRQSVIGRKHFFSEEKKQKTFNRLSGPLSRGGCQSVKRFLVLFFKKELLKPPCRQCRDPRQPQQQIRHQPPRDRPHRQPDMPMSERIHDIA